MFGHDLLSSREATENDGCWWEKVQCGEDDSQNAFYTLMGCTVGNRGMGLVDSACDSMACYSL
jgi:hypothetical protein